MPSHCQYTSNSPRTSGLGRYSIPTIGESVAEIVKNRPDIVVYMHIACIGRWRLIVDRLYSRMKKSGLFMCIKEIRVAIVGDFDAATGLDFLSNPKVKIVFKSPDVGVYEHKIMEILRADAERMERNTYIFYCHSKGVKYPEPTPSIDDWVELLTWVNIDNYDSCCRWLETVDAVGANLLRAPKIHFSGNFWWARHSYIKNLKPYVRVNDVSPEMYIGSGAGMFTSLHNSNVNHYMERYTKDKYIDGLLS